VSDYNILCYGLDFVFRFAIFNISQDKLNSQKEAGGKGMFNILRVKKIKENGKITNVARHNFRLRISQNVDKKRTHLNLTLINTLEVDVKNSSDLQTKLNSHYNDLGIKQKVGNVKMLEFVVSASPQFFGDWHKNGKIRPEKAKLIKEWIRANKDFFKAEFGDNLVLCNVHLDEKTPHMHFCVALTKKSVKKYRNQYGEYFKENWSLSAEKYGPSYLSELHDRHAEANKQFNLLRGIRGNYRQNATTQQFNRMVMGATNEDLEKETKKTYDYIDRNTKTRLFGEPVITVKQAKKAVEIGLEKAAIEILMLKRQNEFTFNNYVEQLKRKNELAEKKIKEAEEARKEFREGLENFDNNQKFINRLQYEAKELVRKMEAVQLELEEKNAMLLKHGLIKADEDEKEKSKVTVKTGLAFPKPKPNK
jgi:hypothetical protein